MASRKKSKSITGCLKKVGIGIAVLSILTMITGRNYIKEYDASEKNSGTGMESISKKYTTDKSKESTTVITADTEDMSVETADTGNLDSESGSTTEFNYSVKKREAFSGDPVSRKIGFYEEKTSGAKPFISEDGGKIIERGFKNFYKKTGVYPYLYVLEESEYPGYDISTKYRELFDENEGCLIILYVAKMEDRDGNQYDSFFIGYGKDTGGILDEESLAILNDRIKSRWDGKHSISSIFGEGLSETADIIMPE